MFLRAKGEGAMGVRCIVLLSLVILPIGIGGPEGHFKPLEVAQAGPPLSAQSNAPWFIETIESTPMVYVGRYVSVDVRQGSAPIMISHYDATNGDLRMARFQEVGGNCGPHNRWHCTLRDGDVGDVGQYSSLALGPILPIWKSSVAYYDAGDGALDYEGIVGSAPGGIGFGPIDSPGLAGFTAGKYASLALDSSGDPHIAYNYRTPVSGGQEFLKYATATPGGTGNCGSGLQEGKWQCDTIDSGAVSRGRYASLDLNGANTPGIAYYNGFSHDLWWAREGGTAPNCGPGGNTWTCLEVDTEGDVGMFASHVWDDSSGIPSIAYFDATNEALKIATFVLSGGNCGFGSGWQCDEIDDMGANISDDHQRISMALDPSGYPVIAYQQTSDVGPAVLKVARPAVALGLDHGNCGPEDPFSTWQCDTMDAGGTHSSVGHYLDIAVNGAGLATIAYYEADSYNLSGNLKVAYQRRVFRFLPGVMRTGQ
jgi:hypothetical protein